MAQPTPGQGRSPAFDDDSLNDIILIDQLDSDNWSEGVAVRPNGQVMATTLLEHAHLFLIDPRYATEHASEYTDAPDSPQAPKLLKAFPGGNSAGNIAHFRGSGDGDDGLEEYLVSTAQVDIGRASFGSVVVWRITFKGDDDDEPTITKVADMPEASFAVGMCQLAPGIVLVADVVRGCVWRLDVASGDYRLVWEEPETMLPEVKEAAFGINRIILSGGFLWYSNTGNGMVHRAPVELLDDGRDLRVTGPPQTVADNLPNADGLVMRRDGSACYVASYGTGKLWRVDIDPATGEGTPTILTRELISPTSMELVYHPGSDKPTLYIVCCGAFYPEQFEGEHGSWIALANVERSKLHIHVTVETTIVYETIEPGQC